MTKRILWLLTLFAVVIVACSSLPYHDDVGFLVSAQADSPEFPVYINGHLCTDMEGGPGLCSKRVASNQDIVFKFDPQTYAYLLTVVCSVGLPEIPPVTIPAGEDFTFSIVHTEFLAEKSFTCIGEISPQDRESPISAKFEVRFKIVDVKYAVREKAYLMKSKGKNVLVLGEHARSAWVFDNGKWTQHQAETLVEIQGDPTQVKAYSESFAMRFNYLNLGDLDSGVVAHD